MNKILSVLLLACLTAAAQDDNRPGPVILQSPGTIAWPFPGVTLTVRPDAIILTNVLTLEISASAAPITSFNINWTTNGPQPGSVNFSDIHSRTTQVTLSIAGTYNLLCVINDGPRFVATPFTVVANVVQNFAPTITPIANQSLDENHSTPAIPFTVGDDITAPGALSVNATSSNPALIDNTGIFLGGGGANRNITLVPKNQQAGTSTITVSVTDGSTPPMTTSISFLLTVSAVNQPPTFTSVPNPVNFSENVPGTFNVGIADPDTPLANLQLTATSTASFLSSLVVTGTGAVRTVNVLPVPNQYGTNTIILHLSDGQNQVSTTLGINVAAVNNAPVISVISPLQQLVGTPTTTAFYINDTEDGGNLTLSRSSDNLAVAPLANLVFGGSGTNRTITFTPAAVGVANVSVWVTDSGSLSATNTFTATGNAIPNTPPTITPPPNTTVFKNQPTGNLPITVGDAETPAVNLILFATSDNLVLTPLSGFTLGGSGANRTIRIVPASNQVGTATITVSVTDGGNLTTPSSFALTVSPTNYPPTISTISNPQVVAENSSISIPFTVGDPDTALASLVLSGVSSDPVVVPAPNITFSGTGANRTGKVQPATNKYGTNTVTFSVNDGTTTVSTNFTLQVTFVNQLPTITALSDTTVSLNTPSTQNLTIGDLETPAANLTLAGSSSNPALVPTSNITFGGAGANRNVTVTPITGQSGSAVITVSVTDANTGSRSSSFTFVVNPGGGARVFYVSPTGSSGNSGLSTSSPWNLGSVTSPGTKGLQGGDLIYLMPGDYGRSGSSRGTWTFSGNYASPITFKGLNRPQTANAAVFDIAMNDTEAQGKGGPPCIDFASGANNIWLWGLELKNSGYRLCDTSAQSGRAGGFYIVNRGSNKIINCLVHDAENGIAIQDTDSLPTGNFEVFGCVTYGNGVCEFRTSLEKDHGHGFYNQAKNLSYTEVMSDCISHNNQGQGHQSSGTDGKLFGNYTLEGTALYNNGYPAGGRNRNVLFGLGNKFSNVTVRSNYTYYPSTGGPSIYFCYPSTSTGTIGNPPFISTNLLAYGNMSMGGDLRWGRWENATFLFNTCFGWAPFESVHYYNQYDHLNNVWDSNTVYGISAPYNADTIGNLTRAQWQSNFGYGAHDNQIVGNPTGQTVIVRVNRYDHDMANVYIYNWSGAANAVVNLTGFLINGDTYDIYNSTNPKVRTANGLYTGSISFPMTQFPMYTHVGTQSGTPALTPRSPEPEFAALQIIRTGHQ